MTKNKGTSNPKSAKRRTQVKDLPQSEKELSKDEQKKVKGGQTSAFMWVGSNRPNQ